MQDSKSILSISALIVAVIIAVATSIFLFYKYETTKQELLSFTGDADVLAVKENKELISKLAGLVDIPNEEEFKVATIKDISKLNQNPFYKNAKNNDKIVYFPISGRAILYRPSENKIIESSIVTVSNLGIAENSNEESEVASATAQTEALESTATNPEVTTKIQGDEKFTISIYNGTNNIPGLAARAETKIKNSEFNSKYNFEVIEKTDSILDHSQTLIINSSGVSYEVILDLIDLLSGVESKFPTEEKAPKGDLLIIVGSEYQD